MAEFEELGRNRYELLKWIENQHLIKVLPEIEKKNIINVKKPKDNIYRKMQTLSLEHKKNDLMSHFILLFACSSNLNASKWFVQQETVLFEYRYNSCPSKKKKLDIEKELGIMDEMITKKRFLQEYSFLNGKFPLLNMSLHVENYREKQELPYHKVKFNEVCDLVSRRVIFLNDGFAFVPHNRFSNVLRIRFRTNLTKRCASLRRKLDNFTELKNNEYSSRVVPILQLIPKSLDQQHEEKKVNRENLTNESISRFKKYMPLCMQLIIDKDCLEKKYVRHWGILHLSLFLKSIGLPLVEAQKFWHKSLENSKKRREVSNNIKHMFGSSGSRKKYDPYSCHKMTQIIPDDSLREKECHFGCPFVYKTNREMIDILKNKKIYNDEIKEIVKNKKEKKYSIACKIYFGSLNKDVMSKRGLKLDDLKSKWDHPNTYFEKSYRLYNYLRV